MKNLNISKIFFPRKKYSKLQVKYFMKKHKLSYINKYKNSYYYIYIINSSDLYSKITSYQYKSAILEVGFI